MIAAFAGKNFHEMVGAGIEKMSSMGGGGGAPAAAGGAAAAPKEDEKKEEEEDVNMGDLFGGDDDGY